MKVFVASVMLLVSTLSWATEESIFLKDKPIDCMSAIERALINRRWKISFIDKSSVRASISGRVAAEISIFYREGSFYYLGKATKEVRNVNSPNPSLQRQILDTDIPGAWVENLKRDTINFCSSSSPLAGEEKDVKSRLKELQYLHKEGLISDDEYKDLRKNILESI